MTALAITGKMDDAALAVYMERIDRMTTRAAAEAAAAQPELAQFANALALVQNQSYVRIMVNGESRIVLVINVPNTLSVGAPEISRFFDSTSMSDLGRTLLKSHLPEVLGTFNEYCQHADHRDYLRAAMKHASIEDSVQMVRVIDVMARTQAGLDEAAVWKAIEAVRSIKPLPSRQPGHFDKEEGHAPH